MTFFVYIGILLRFLNNSIEQVYSYEYADICVETINDDTIFKYSPLNDNDCENDEDNNEQYIHAGDEEETQIDKEKTQVDDKQEEIIYEEEMKDVEEMQYEEEMQDVEQTKKEGEGSSKIDKGKGKRIYDSDDDSGDSDYNKKQETAKNLKRFRDNEYRAKSEEDDSSNYSYSEDEQSEFSENYNDKNEDENEILIVTRPEIIDDKINQLNKDLELVNKTKSLDEKSPSDLKELNDNIAKLSVKGYEYYFSDLSDRDINLKENLEKIEESAKEELADTEKERLNCKKTMNAEGSEIVTWNERTLYVKTSKAFHNDYLNNLVSPSSSPNTEIQVDSNTSSKEYTSYSPNKENIAFSPDTQNSPNLSKDNPSEMKMELDTDTNSLPSNEKTLPFSESSVQKAEETSNSSPNKIQYTDADKVQHTGSTPGDYIDNLPQDMPSFIDDID